MIRLKWPHLAVLLLLFPWNTFGVINGIRLNLDHPLYRSTVGIQIGIPGSTFFCSGVLIAPQVVLTAAHCILADHSASKTIRVGFGSAAMSLSEPDLVREVLTAEFHPKNLQYLLANHPGGYRHDLALLQLRSDAPEGFIPAKLGTRAADMHKGLKMILAGYGCVLKMGADHHPIGIKGADGLHAVNSQIATWAPHVVTAEKGRGGSFGDSGMPAYFFDTQGKPVVGAIASIITQVHFQTGKYEGDNTTFLAVPSGPENMSWITSILEKWGVDPDSIQTSGRGLCPELLAPKMGAAIKQTP